MIFLFSVFVHTHICSRHTPRRVHKSDVNFTIVDWLRFVAMHPDRFGNRCDSQLLIFFRIYSPASQLPPLKREINMSRCETEIRRNITEIKSRAENTADVTENKACHGKSIARDCPRANLQGTVFARILRGTVFAQVLRSASILRWGSRAIFIKETVARNSRVCCWKCRNLSSHLPRRWDVR